MNHQIVVRPSEPLPPNPQKVTTLISAFLSGRNRLTIKAYRQDIADFASFIHARDSDEAARRLLSLTPGDANSLALGYKTHLVNRGLKGATINRRLAALRAMVKLARTLGLVAWTLEIQNLKLELTRDLRGPTRDTLKKVLLELSARPDPKTKRDVAILRLLHDLGLRRGEIVSLDLEHLDLADGTVSVLGKGRSERITLTLPAETKMALTAWITARGTAPGAVFTNFDRARKSARLSGTSIYRLTRRLGLGRPHGLRHLAITEAPDLWGGDIRRVQRFSRHRDIRVLLIYDDNRQDLAGEVARGVAANV